MDIKPKEKSSKKVYYAKFYDIAHEIDPEFDMNGFLRPEMNNPQNINKVLDKHPEFNPGDVLFVGSTYETRQEYGFAIYLPGFYKKKDKKDVNIVGGEYGFSLPIEIVDKIELGKKYGEESENPLENVRYSKLIQQFIKSSNDDDEEFLIGLFLGSDWKNEEGINEVVEEYKERGLWD